MCECAKSAVEAAYWYTIFEMGPNWVTKHALSEPPPPPPPPPNKKTETQSASPTRMSKHPIAEIEDKTVPALTSGVGASGMSMGNGAWTFGVLLQRPAVVLMATFPLGRDCCVQGLQLALPVLAAAARVPAANDTWLMLANCSTHPQKVTAYVCKLGTGPSYVHLQTEHNSGLMQRCISFSFPWFLFGVFYCLSLCVCLTVRCKSDQQVDDCRTHDHAFVAKYG